MINCLKGVIFVSLKTASIPQLLTIIKSELQHCMTPTATDAAGRELELRQLSASRVIAIADRRSARYSRRAGYE